MGHAACNAESYSWMLSKVKEWFNDWDSLQVHVSMENHEMHRLMMKQEAQTIGGRRGRFTMDAIAFSADQVSLTHKKHAKIELKQALPFQQGGFLAAMDNVLPNNPILQCNSHLRSKISVS